MTRLREEMQAEIRAQMDAYRLEQEKLVEGQMARRKELQANPSPTSHSLPERLQDCSTEALLFADLS